MGLDVYLYRYNGERTYAEDDQEFLDHQDFFDGLWSQVRREVAGEPVRVVEETPLGPREMDKPLTDEEYDEVSRLIRLRQSQYIEKHNLHLQIGEYGVEIPEEKIEIDSEKYPDHLFKIGYMRSSYNSGGFNSVVSELVGHDLYWLFGVDGTDNYIVHPDWKVASTRCQMLIDQLAMDPGYIVMRVDLENPFDDGFMPSGQEIEERDTLRYFMQIQEDIDNVADGASCDGMIVWPEGRKLLAVVKAPDSHVVMFEDEEGNPYAFNPKNGSDARYALAKFNEKMEEYKKQKEKNNVFDFSSFSCLDGAFFLNGVDVLAMKYVVGFGGARCIDFIRHDEENSKWYYEAAVIVKEMIDWVLSQPDPNEYYFHWSG